MSRTYTEECKVCQEEGCRWKIAAECKTHRLSLCSKCLVVLHSTCPNVTIQKCEEVYMACFERIRRIIEDIREFNIAHNSSISLRHPRFEQELNGIETTLYYLHNNSRSYQDKLKGNS